MAEMLHPRVSDTTLGVVRFAVYAMWLKHLLQDPLVHYLGTPLEQFQPIGPLAWFPAEWWPQLYRAEVLQGGRAVLLVGLTWCLLGLRPYRPVALFLCVGLTLYQAFVRGYQYLHHGELPMLIAVFVVAIYPAARGFSLRRGGLFAAPGPSTGDALNRAAMLTLCLAFCLTYSFVGTQRLLHGGVEIYFDRTILHQIARYAFSDPAAPGIGRVVLEIPALGVVTAAGYAMTTFLELLAPLAIFWRPFRWLWIVGIVAFHIGAGLLMGIWFTANIALIVLCMTNLDWTLRWGNQLLARLGLGPIPLLPLPIDDTPGARPVTPRDRGDETFNLGAGGKSQLERHVDPTREAQGGDACDPGDRSDARAPELAASRAGTGAEAPGRGAPGDDD